MQRNWGVRVRGFKGGERRRPPRTRFSWEALERRELLAADVSAVGVGRGVGWRGVDARTGVFTEFTAEYTVTITNHGDAEPVVLTNVVDPRLESIVVSAPDVAGHYTTSRDEAGVLTVSFPEFAGTVEVFIKGGVPLSPTEVPAPPLTYDYSITTADPNTNPQTSGSILVDAPYPFADASLTHQVNPSPIPRGADVVYSFVVANNSTVAPVPNARIVINLPESWTGDNTGYSSGANPGWTPSYMYPPIFDIFAPHLNLT